MGFEKTVARRGRRRRAWVLRVEALEERRLLSTFTVNTTSDDSTDTSVLTLREAIELADGTLASSSLSAQQQQQVSATPAGQSVISFDITQGSAPYIISPTAYLPAITSPVTINGYTQPGARVATASTPANIPIILDGSKISVDYSGFYFSGAGTAGSSIIGLDFINFGAPGGWCGAVSVFDSNHVTVLGNYFGFSPYITTGPTQNYDFDLEFYDCSNDVIGEGYPDTRNVFRTGADSSQPNPSSQPETEGIELQGDADETVQGNYVGFDPSGNVFPNVLNLYIDGVQVNDTHNSLIGGGKPGQGNALSGLWMGSMDNQPVSASDNVVQGNTISVSPNDSTLYNGEGGVNLLDSTGDLFGGPLPGEGNVIANSAGHNGIDAWENSPTQDMDLTIQGNYIGTDPTLTRDFPLYDGVHLVGSDDLVGGMTPSEGNYIDNSSNFGIFTDSGEGGSVTNNQEFSNRIRFSGEATSPAPDQPATPVVNIVAPAANGSGVFVAGTLTGATPGEVYTAQFFTDDRPDADGLAETQYDGATVTATAGTNGVVHFSSIIPTSIMKSSASIVTAMITGTTGTTSQIAAGVTAAASLAETLKAAVSPTATAPGTPVTITATLTAPAASWVQPSGTVEFLDNGVPIGSATLGTSGAATLTTSSLAPGTQTITVVYQGNALYPKAESKSVIETIYSVPTVLAVARVNATEVQVDYSLSMDPTSTTLATNYQLIALKRVGGSYVTTGNPISLKVTLDATHRLVTLTPASKLATGTIYRLTISSGVKDAQGVALAGYVGSL